MTLLTSIRALYTRLLQRLIPSARFHGESVPLDAKFQPIGSVVNVEMAR